MVWVEGEGRNDPDKERDVLLAPSRNQGPLSYLTRHTFTVPRASSFIISSDYPTSGYKGAEGHLVPS